MNRQNSQDQIRNDAKQQNVQFFLKMKAQPNLTCYIITVFEDLSQLLDMIIHTSDEEHIIFSATVTVIEQAVYQYKFSQKIDGVNQTEQYYRLFQFNNSSKVCIDEWNKFWCEYSFKEIKFGAFEIFNIQILKENSDSINLIKSKDQNKHHDFFEQIENTNQPVYRSFYFSGIYNQQLQFESQIIDINQQKIVMNKRYVIFSMYLMGDNKQKMQKEIDYQIKLRQEYERNRALQEQFLQLIEENRIIQQKITHFSNNANLQDLELKRSIEQEVQKKLVLSNQYISSEQSILQFKQQLEYNKSQFLVQLEKDNYQMQKYHEDKLNELNQFFMFEKSLKEEEFFKIQNQKNEEILKSKYLLEQSIQKLQQQQENQLQNKIQSLNLQPVIIENIEDVPESVKNSLQKLKDTLENLELEKSESTYKYQRQVQNQVNNHQKFKQKQASLDATQQQIKDVEDIINQIEQESAYSVNKQEIYQQQFQKIKDQLKAIKEQIKICKQEILETINQSKLADERKQNLNKEIEEQKQNLEKFQIKIQQQKEEAENQFQEVLMKNKEKQQQIISQINLLHQKQIDQQKEFFNNFQRDLQQKIVRKFIEAEQQYFQKARIFQNEINVLINQQVDAIKKYRIQFKDQNNQLNNEILLLLDQLSENQNIELIEQLLNLIRQQNQEVFNNVREALGQMKKLMLSKILQSSELNYQQVYSEYFSHLIESECNIFFEQFLQQAQRMI